MIVWGKQLSQAFDFAGGGRARPQKGINFFCSQQVVYLGRKPLQHLLLFRLLHGFYRGDVQAIDDALHCHVAGKVPQILLYRGRSIEMPKGTAQGQLRRPLATPNG